MAKANFFYNSRERRWEIRNRAGVVVAEWSDDAFSRDRQGRIVEGIGTIQRANVGSHLIVGSGVQIQSIMAIRGTLGGIAAVGTGAVTAGTITGMTGLAVNDKIFGVPVQALAGNIGVVGFRVPTANVLNAYIANTAPDSAGSIPATAFDIIAFRTA